MPLHANACTVNAIPKWPSVSPPLSRSLAHNAGSLQCGRMCVMRRDACLTRAAHSTRILSLSYAHGVGGLARAGPGGRWWVGPATVVGGPGDGGGWAWWRRSVGRAAVVGGLGGGDRRHPALPKTGIRRQKTTVSPVLECRLSIRPVYMHRLPLNATSNCNCAHHLPLSSGNSIIAAVKRPTTRSDI